MKYKQQIKNTADKYGKFHSSKQSFNHSFVQSLNQYTYAIVTNKPHANKHVVSPTNDVVVISPNICKSGNAGKFRTV